MKGLSVAPLRMALVAACSFALAFAASAWGWRLANGSTAPAAASGAVAAESGGGPVRRELLMVYIGSSTCEASNSGQLRRDVRELRTLLAGRAAAAGRSLVTLGVAVDGRASAGIAHLQKVAPFDEVAAGGGWANAHALKYVWEKWPGVAGTPQIVVIDREIRVRRGGPGGVTYSSGAERMVARLAGAWEISRWRSNGAPLPRLP